MKIAQNYQRLSAIKGIIMSSVIQDFLFCLGGHDLEMLTIKQLLAEHSQHPVLDKNLSWGAAASAYKTEISKAIRQNITPVLVELENDLKLNSEQVILIDHHGKQAGATQPTALHQVFNLLSLPASNWTRWFDLVAANDRNHIAGLQAINASQAEIIKIREADRRAQGISAADDTAAQQALGTIEIKNDGALCIVHLNHCRTTAVVDALHPALGGVGYRNLLIVSPQELNFFGEGPRVQALAKEFSNSWYGGALPTRGFWGCKGVEANKIIDSLLKM
jgi:hypothetical protein